MGADSSNPFGQSQLDATAVKGLSATSTIFPNPHHHYTTAYNEFIQGGVVAGSLAGGALILNSINSTGANLDCSTTLSSTDSETRPKNVRMNWIIKY